jgi:hypothetical protein
LAIVRAKVTVVGSRPLLWHHFGSDALPLEKKARSGVAGNDPLEWTRTVLATKDRQLYLEPSYIFGCVKNGGKHTRRGKGSFQPLVASTVQILDEHVLIDRWLPKTGLQELRVTDGVPVYLDVRSVTNPGTRGRNVRYRVAAAPGWKAEFTMAWDNSLISANEMAAILKDAGQFEGLGDGRRIGFGRFEVDSFRTLEVPVAKKPATKRTVAGKTR